MTTSVASRGSSKSSTRNKYRTKAKTSTVDESLFGNSQSQQNKDARRNTPLTTEEVLHFSTGKGLPISNKVKPKSRKPETVRVITKDLIRDVVVPSENNQSSIILNFSEYKKIKKNAKDTSVEDVQCKKKAQEEYEKRQEEMRARKALFTEYDIKRTEKAEATDLEAESRTIAADLLKRSQQKRLEENDEIKHLNELILEAKCHAIRDAQISEKHQLASQMFEENDRLDAMMEIDRVAGMMQQEEVVKKRKEQRQKGAVQIMQQIEANASEKLLEAEKKDQEAKILVSQQRRMQMDDLQEIEKKKLEQKKLQKEIDLINKEHQRLKEIKLDQENVADLRVAAYQKEKAAREAEKESNLKQKATEKELEIAKLRAAQERASDLQAERDALRAKRHEEATEREFRRKTREEAAKKKAMDMEMAAAREEQITNKRHMMAIQAARERAEFDKELRFHQQEMASMAVKADNVATSQRKYASEVREQIKERESKRIDERKAFFEETINMDKEIEDKKKQLEQVKKKKLRDLKESGVPEKYVMEVARRIGLTDL